MGTVYSCLSWEEYDLDELMDRLRKYKILEVLDWSCVELG
jgi:hypothetical protein